VRILLTNDDGINAPGLAALADEMSGHGEVIIYAPVSEMSAVGHAITLSDPLRVVEFHKNGRLFGHAVRGTPADCVKIATWVLNRQDRKPDILISGINLGSNTGINTIYSGTVSAATEGAIFGIPAIAISLASFTSRDFSVAAQFAPVVARHLLANPLPPGVFRRRPICAGCGQASAGQSAATGRLFERERPGGAQRSRAGHRHHQARLHQLYRRV